MPEGGDDNAGLLDQARKFFGVPTDENAPPPGLLPRLGWNVASDWMANQGPARLEAGAGAIPGAMAKAAVMPFGTGMVPAFGDVLRAYNAPVAAPPDAHPAPDFVPQQLDANGMPVARAALPLPPGPATAPKPKAAAGAPSGGSSAGGAGLPQPNTAAHDAAAKQQQDAARQLGAANADQAKALGEANAQEQQAQADRTQRYMKLVQDNTDEGLRRLKASNDEIDGVGKDGRQLDPERWWKSRTQGQRVWGTIATVLGGAATAFGGENVGGKLISDAVARDVDAQKFNLTRDDENAKFRATAHQSALGHFAQLTGNQQAAVSLTNAWGLEQAKLRIEGIKQTLTAPAEIARANQAVADLEQKKAEYKDQAAKAIGEQALQRAQIAHLNAETALTRQQAAVAGQKANGAVMVGGTPVIPRNDEDRKHLEEMVRAGGTGYQALKSNQAAQEEAGTLDRAQAFFHKFPLIGHLVPEPAYLKTATAAQDAASMNSNRAMGIDNGTSVPQFEAQKESLTASPLNPESVRGPTHTFVQSYRDAIIADLMGRGVNHEEAEATALRQYPPLRGESPTMGVPGAKKGW